MTVKKPVQMTFA